MRQVLTNILVFICFCSFAQWHNLGKSDTTTIFVSENRGYFFLVEWHSPGSGYTHRFYEFDVNNYGEMTGKHKGTFNMTLDYASQKVSRISFVNDSLGVFATNCLMMRTRDNYLTWELDFSLGPASIVAGILKTIYLYSFRSMNQVYCVIRLNPFESDFSLLHRLNTDTVTHPLPVKFTEYKQMEFVNDSTGFILADDVSHPSTLLRTDNKGQSFTEVISSDAAKLNQMCFPSEKVGYVCADSGKLYKTTDAGINWVSFSLPSNKKMRAIAFMNDSVGYVAGDDTLIFKTTDGGSTWKGIPSSIKPFPAGNYITRLFHFKNDVAYALHSRGYLEKNQIADKPTTTNPVVPEFTVYPNPAVDILELIYPDLSQASSVVLYNTLGQPVYKQNLSGNSASLSISQFPAGVYYLHADHNGTIHNIKVIKAYEK